MSLTQPEGATLPKTVAAFEAARAAWLSAGKWIDGDFDSPECLAYGLAYRALAGVVQRLGGRYDVGPIRYVYTPSGLSVEERPPEATPFSAQATPAMESGPQERTMTEEKTTKKGVSGPPFFDPSHT